MAQFLFDADTSPALHRLIEQRGHSIRRTGQEGALHTPDDLVLLLATNLERILVTHNERDFLLLARAWRSFARQWEATPRPHAGVIAIPQLSRLPNERALSEIDTLVRTQRELSGHVFTYSLRWGWTLDPNLTAAIPRKAHLDNSACLRIDV